MAEITDLDKRDKSNLYSDTAVNVRALSATEEEVRDFLDGKGELLEQLNDAFDEAQGEVFSGAQDVSYVVIKISKEG